jgi:hypothetical protein
MLNDQPSDIERIGSVRIHMFDGVICTLTNIRFIPNMRKNLISLGILDTNELSLSASGGLLQVKNDDVTILWGHKHQNRHKICMCLKALPLLEKYMLLYLRKR